jgi:hypothetical protein
MKINKSIYVHINLQGRLIANVDRQKCIPICVLQSTYKVNSKFKQRRLCVCVCVYLCIWKANSKCKQTRGFCALLSTWSANNKCK